MPRIAIFEHDDFPDIRVQVKRPDQQQRAKYLGQAHMAAEGKLNVGEAASAACAAHVRGWDGLDEPFKNARTAPKRMPADLQIAIFGWLTNDCRHIDDDDEDEEEGNSDSSSD